MESIDAEVVYYTSAEDVGRLRGSDGRFFRFNRAACTFDLPAVRGLTVRVLQIEPLMFGRWCATRVELVDSRETYEAKAVAAAAYERDVQEQVAALDAIHAARPPVVLPPLSPEVRGLYAEYGAEQRRREREQSKQMRAERAEMRKRAMKRSPESARAKWTELLAAEGLDAGLLQHGLPAALLVAAKASRGRSRFGGPPRLPPGFMWPRHEGVALTHLLQIATSELPPAVRASLHLADAVVLTFFYDAHCERQPWGDQAAEAGAARVFCTPLATSTVVYEHPDPQEPEARIEPGALLLAPDLRLPHVGARTRTAQRAAWIEAGVDLDRYEAAYEAYEDSYEVPNHLLGGYPDCVQQEMNEDAARMLELPADDARGMRLLLQLDTDEQNDMIWGDYGRLYFWIHERDLIAQRFDRVWCILQCT